MSDRPVAPVKQARRSRADPSASSVRVCRRVRLSGALARWCPRCRERAQRALRSVRIIYPSGTRASHSRAQTARPACWPPDRRCQNQRPKTTSTSEKELAPIRGGLPKNGTARPRLPSIDRHRPEPVKGKPALDGTRPTRATRRTPAGPRTATTAATGTPPPPRPAAGKTPGQAPSPSQHSQGSVRTDPKTKRTTAARQSPNRHPTAASAVFEKTALAHYTDTNEALTGVTAAY
jgi:hypothetical protein